MVVKLVRWPSRPPFSSKKYDAIINLRQLQGLANLSLKDSRGNFFVEIKWKGHKTMGLSSWRRSVKRNYTENGVVRGGGESVDWNEEFRSLCSIFGSKEDPISPWEVSFTVLQKGENQVPRKSSTVVGTASLNISDYVSSANGKEIFVTLPLKVQGSIIEFNPSLLLSLKLLELRVDTKHSKTVSRSIMPVTRSPPSTLALSSEKDGLAAIKASLDRVKIFGQCMSAGRANEVFQEQEIDVDRLCIEATDSHYSCSLDSDSFNDSGREDSCVRRPTGYGKLAHVNRLAGLFVPDMIVDNEDEFRTYCSSGARCLETDSPVTMQQNSMRKILSWRKRKLSFKSMKNKGEPLLKKHYGEEGGDDIDFDRRQLSPNEFYSAWYNLQLSIAAFGDDKFSVGTWEQKEIMNRDGHLKLQTEVFFASIDQRSERAAGESACTALVSVIADWLLTNEDEMPIKSELDNLIKEGSAEWRNLCENEDYMERFSDKHFDLDTIIEAKIRPLTVVAEKSYVGFFHPEGLEEGVFEFLKGAMSFDTIWDEISLLASENDGDFLVYIVSWNDHFFILKIERDAYYIIDTLGERLYEGCNQAYILKFDNETKICRISDDNKASEEEKTSNDTVPSNDTQSSKEKSSSIATQRNNSKETNEASLVKPKEASMAETEEESMTKNEATLMGRTTEDSTAKIEEASTRKPIEDPSTETKEDLSAEEENDVSSSEIKEVSAEKNVKEIEEELENGDKQEEEVICRGKECCQEYIKSFLAAIPIRELQEDVKKGLNSSSLLHQRLQIEFHRTKLSLDQILDKKNSN